jgi:tRNA (adenine37-N6)-methyltransferase
MMTLRPIGTLHTPWRAISECPRNGRQPNPAPLCTAVVLPEFVEGLRSVETLSHLILLYWMDQVKSAELVFTPPFDDQPRGIFATRSPRRPNPIGLSIVALERMAGDTLYVRYLDCVDGTPLLDIKPYFPSTDCEPGASMGWLRRPG